MGTPEEEKDWLDVANDLLSKCHIEQKLTKLTDCDANVFISLYENILKETVPDYIASPSSQEDDVHNVQCVIDSLSLDYLQISLSHITGENVIRGDKESIKNLLDIFDGLLEYLSEEIKSVTCNGGLGEDFPGETEEPTYSNVIDYMDATTEGTSLPSDGGESAPQSIENSEHSGKSERMGSASELIGLGVSARTFTDNQEEQAVPLQTTDAITTTGLSEDQDPPLTVQVHSAIALHPPTQSDSPHPCSLGRTPKTAGDAATVQTSSAGNGRVDCNGVHSPAQSQRDSSIQERNDIGGETLEPTNGGPRRVLFHMQPDVLFLTLQDELPATTPSPPETEEEEQEEDLSSTRGSVDHQHGTSLCNLQEDEEDIMEQRSHRRERGRKGAEKELHHISEKLAHRIEELDQMLKRLLGNSGEPGAVRDEDELSQHSDSITQPRRTLRQHIGTPECFSYTLPPRGHHSVQEHSEDDEAEPLSPDGRQTNIPAGALWQSEPLRRRKHRKTVVNQAYEKELRRLECKKRAVVDKERHKAQEAEREYREAILKDFSKAPTMSPSTMKSQQNLNTQATSGRLRIPKKTPPLKVRENELLPVLLEELPYLQMSPREVDRMWQQQRQQMERLHALSSSHRQRRSKLSKEVEDAQRKHDLLAGMVHKQQEHSRRLRDFKEHIQHQRSTQNRLREQRQQVARARKYHQDYHVQHRARLMRARTKEERMFRQLFEEGLELQKARLREQREYATQQRQQHDKQHQDHIQSMENYYKDQFSLLAEKLAQERQEIQIRKKAQEKVLLKMKRELRSRMEHEIGELQKIIVQNDEDDYFEDIEVQRLRNRVRMASFQYRKNYLH
ncbi:centrosomal protein of 95 kDa-like isoform X2 [Dunckerocampus dactyliophorus]|uniref:centrosomal protein of 95 kDa-like isoform X2 n=1 Tax=Dunckerocampus dactyliophorus TaxID=161453 RepID=UPI002406F6D9|nr:centrosomal protein of 95 kDa-like isoform X2 [Dunckerocampus dactyliophorus]